MKSFRSFASIALISCMAAACATLATVASPLCYAYRWAKALVLEGFNLAVCEPVAQARPTVAMVQAKAFVQRLVKRERPTVTGSWRMCPST